MPPLPQGVPPSYIAQSLDSAMLGDDGGDDRSTSPLLLKCLERMFAKLLLVADDATAAAADADATGSDGGDTAGTADGVASSSPSGLTIGQVR